ncbi:hypothetical protein Hdeb2414_s0140g00810771 [Helianthus debilis subsp. tardiflorus]
MATVPPKPLHNFSLPFLKWGQFRRPHRHRTSPATDSSDLNRIHNITKQKPDKQNHKTTSCRRRKQTAATERSSMVTW